MTSSTERYQRNLEHRLRGLLFRLHLPGNDRRVLPDLHHHGAVAGLLASDSHHRPCSRDYTAATAIDVLGIRPASAAAAAADLPHHDVAVDGGTKACSPNSTIAVHRPNRDCATVTAIADREEYTRRGSAGDFLNCGCYLPGSHLLSSVGCCWDTCLDNFKMVCSVDSVYL